VTAPPGDYSVRAYIGTNVRPSKDPAFAYVTTFYPGVPSRDGAQVLHLASGTDQYDVEFAPLSGRTLHVSGTPPLAGFDVVLFPQDEARWYFASPLIRQTRSHQNGQFELALVPPGDYLAVATEGVPFLMLGDPAATLRRLQSIATRVTVRDGEQKTISIRASPAP